MRLSAGRAALAARESSGPRVRVAGIIQMDGKIVVARHRAGSKTYHLLPGGGVEYRETLADALVREVQEETGLLVEPLDVLFINDTIDPEGTRHVVNVTFSCSVIAGMLADTPQDPRVEAVELVTIDDVLNLDFRPPFARQLVDALRGGDSEKHYLGSLFVPG